MSFEAQIDERGAREDGVHCLRCGGTDLASAWQTFANGTRHIRVSCVPCGAYVRYAPQTPANVARADAAPAWTERR